jgi:PAS domain S-box-containing protein
VTSSPLVVNGVQRGAVSIWRDVTGQREAEKAKEQALAQAEEGNLRLEALLDFIPEGICITSGPPDFAIKRISHYGLEMTANLDASRVIGVPAGQHAHALGLLLSDGVTEPSPEETPLYRAAHFGEVVLNQEMVLRTQDGVQTPILMLAAPIRNAQGQIIAAINSWRDFTEVKQLEESLRTARDQAMWLARLPGENPNPVARVSDTGIVLYHNRPAAALAGWTCVLNEPLPMPLRALVQQALSQGQTVEQDVMLGRKFYLVSVVPILNEGYANIYGRDITEHKRAQEELRESERRQRELSRLLELDQVRLASVLRHLPVGVWILDQQGRLTGNNPEADRIWAGEAPLLNSIAEFQKYMSWHAESGELLTPEEYPVVVALRAGEPVEPMELNIRRFDGSKGTVLASAAPIKNGLGQLMGVVGVNVDITERKRAEEERLLAEQQYAILFNAVREGFAHYKAIRDKQGNLVDLRVMDINPTGALLSGVSREDQVGKTWRQMWPGMEEKLFAIYDHVNKTGQPIRFDNENNLTGRTYDVVITKVAQDEFLATFNDITERKQSEKALEESKNRINDILKSLGGGLLALDCTWTIIYVNEKATEIAGFSADELIGRTLWELWPELLGTKVEKSYRRSMEARVVEQFQVQGSQSGRWYEVSVYPSSEGITVFYIDKTEQILAEERFNQAFHASPNALVISRQEDGFIEAVNQTFIRFFGYSEQEVIGKTSTELGMFVIPADRQEAVRRLQRDRSVRDFELDVRLKSGEVRNVSLSIEMMDVGGKSKMLTTIQDITLHKRAEEALRESEQRLKRAQEMAHLGSWELDLVNNRLTWSDEVYRIFGLQPQEFGATYEGFLQVVHPDDRSTVDHAYSSSIREGRDAYEIEHRVVKHLSGEVRIVHEKCEHFRDQSGQVIRSIGMVQDITERKQAEEALQESERRFRSLADSMPQLVWTALPDGTVDYYNSRYQEYHEIKQLEPTAWEWAPVLHPDDLQPTVDAWQHALKTGETYQIEHRVRMANGSYRWHLSRGVPVLHENGQIVRWFGTATDIHDVKLAEEQLKDYAERLERSNRELEQFAFMASHDLQEPLRKIEMFGDLLLERATSLDVLERNHLERMRNAAGRMRDMVTGLLQLSRIATQGKPFISVDLSQVISEVLADMEHEIRRTGAKVSHSALPVVEGDPVQLRQLMQNLISNALKYHPPDTTPEVKIYADQLPRKVHIIVKDRGIGFEQEDAERIFQPFQRLVRRSEYDGSGIGLAICRRIVERHAGNIAALSKPGHGTTFIITLPIQHS